MLAVAQMIGSYCGGFFVSASLNSHSLHIGDADSAEERDGRIAPSAGSGDEVEVVRLL